MINPTPSFMLSSTTVRWLRYDAPRAMWNYVGSVAHWIYPPHCASRPAVWSATVWSLSLAALIAALAEACLAFSG